MCTGGGGAATPALSDKEERLMALVGWNIAEGCKNLPEEIVPA